MNCIDFASAQFWYMAFLFICNVFSNEVYKLNLKWCACVRACSSSSIRLSWPAYFRGLSVSDCLALELQTGATIFCFLNKNYHHLWVLENKLWSLYLHDKYFDWAISLVPFMFKTWVIAYGWKALRKWNENSYSRSYNVYRIIFFTVKWFQIQQLELSNFDLNT